MHEEAEEHVTDPQVLDIVMFVIRDLDDEGKIRCKCPERTESDGEGDSEYDAEVLPDGVRVTCRRCGATKLIPTQSLMQAHDFLNCDSLILE